MTPSVDLITLLPFRIKARLAVMALRRVLNMMMLVADVPRPLFSSEKRRKRIKFRSDALTTWLRKLINRTFHPAVIVYRRTFNNRLSLFEIKYSATMQLFN